MPADDLPRARRRAFALEFVGLSSRLAGKVVGPAGDGMVAVDTAVGRLLGRGSFVAGADVVVGVRPERITVGAAGENRVARRAARRGVPGLEGAAALRQRRGGPAAGRDRRSAGGLPAPGTAMQLGLVARATR